MRVLTICSCTLLILGSLVASSPVSTSASAASDASADPIQRFLSRPPENLTSYRAFRTLRASNKRFKKDGWMTAWTELDPHGGFRYEIVAEGGSDYIRRKVLHKMLDGERDAIASGQPGRVALSPANYRFSVMSDDGQIAKLQIVPLRADTLLVNGTVTIEAGTGDLVERRGPPGEESVVLDQPRRGLAPLRTHRGRSRAAAGRINRQRENRRHIRVLDGLRIRVHQRFSRQQCNVGATITSQRYKSRLLVVCCDILRGNVASRQPPRRRHAVLYGRWRRGTAAAAGARLDV